MFFFNLFKLQSFKLFFLADTDITSDTCDRTDPPHFLSCISTCIQCKCFAQIIIGNSAPIEVSASNSGCGTFMVNSLSPCTDHSVIYPLRTFLIKLHDCIISIRMPAGACKH